MRLMADCEAGRVEKTPSRLIQTNETFWKDAKRRISCLKSKKDAKRRIC